jgi:TRAP-type C4-dicarboxylate transport system substrate-binding protein
MEHDINETFATAVLTLVNGGLFGTGAKMMAEMLNGKIAIDVDYVIVEAIIWQSLSDEKQTEFYNAVKELRAW